MKEDWGQLPQAGCEAVKGRELGREGARAAMDREQGER